MTKIYSSSTDFTCNYRFLDNIKDIYSDIKNVNTSIEDIQDQLVLYQFEVLSDPWSIFQKKLASFHRPEPNSIENNSTSANNTIHGITTYALLQAFLSNQNIENFSKLELKDDYGSRTVYDIERYLLADKKHISLLQEQTITEKKFFDDYCLPLAQHINLLDSLEIIHVPSNEYKVLFNVQKECIYFKPQIYILSGEIWKKHDSKQDSYLLPTCPEFTEEKKELSFLNHLYHLYNQNFFPKLEPYGNSIIGFALAHHYQQNKEDTKDPIDLHYIQHLPTTGFGSKTDSYLYPLKFFIDNDYSEAWDKAHQIVESILHREVNFEESIRYTNLILGICTSYLCKKHQVDKMLHLNFKEIVNVEVDESYVDSVYTQINCHVFSEHLDHKLSQHLSKNNKRNKI